MFIIAAQMTGGNKQPPRTLPGSQPANNRVHWRDPFINSTGTDLWKQIVATGLGAAEGAHPRDSLAQLYARLVAAEADDEIRVGVGIVRANKNVW